MTGCCLGLRFLHQNVTPGRVGPWESPGFGVTLGDCTLAPLDETIPPTPLWREDSFGFWPDQAVRHTSSRASVACVVQRDRLKSSFYFICTFIILLEFHIFAVGRKGPGNTWLETCLSFYKIFTRVSLRQ